MAAKKKVSRPEFFEPPREGGAGAKPPAKKKAPAKKAPAKKAAVKKAAVKKVSLAEFFDSMRELAGAMLPAKKKAAPKKKTAAKAAKKAAVKKPAPSEPVRSAAAQRADAYIAQTRTTDDPDERTLLVEAALAEDPGHIPSLVLKALSSGTIHDMIRGCEDALDLATMRLSQAKRRGETAAALGQTPEGKDYRFARKALAGLDQKCGDYEQAYDGFCEVVSLDPDDVERGRDGLLSCMLAMDEVESAQRLLDDFPDDRSDVWLYGRALVAHRKDARSGEARRLLQKAVDASPSAARLLLLTDRELMQRKGGRDLVDLAADFGVDGDSFREALRCRFTLGDAWRKSEGALQRLADASLPPGAPLPKALEPPPTLPPPRSSAWREQLAAAPRREGEVWLVAVRKFDAWLQVKDSYVRPWAAAVWSQQDDAPRAVEILEREPTAEQLLDLFAKAALAPVDEGPQIRPEAVSFKEPERLAAVRAELEAIDVGAIDVGAVEGGRTERFEARLASLAADIGGVQPPSLVGTPGLSEAGREAFYRAAHAFYDRKPWNRIDSDDVLHVEFVGDALPTRYGVVMGHGGEVFGLMLYTDFAALSKMLRLATTADFDGCIAIQFEPFDLMNVADYDDLDAHGWIKPDDRGWPCIVRTDASGDLVRLTAEEVAAATCCLQAAVDLLDGPAARRRSPQPVSLTLEAGGVSFACRVRLERVRVG